MTLWSNQQTGIIKNKSSDTMNRLYTIGFQRILRTLNAEEISPRNILEVLKRNGISQYGDYVYHRVARQNLRQFSKNPCPIQKLVADLPNQENATEIYNQQAIIRCSKKLRQSFSVEEDKICNKCHFKSTCSLQGKSYEPNDQFDQLTSNSVSTLLIYMQQMQKNSLIMEQIPDVKNEVGYRVWKQGYKTCDSVISLLQDLKTGGHETRQFEKIRLQYISDLQSGKIVKEAEQKVEPETTSSRKQINNKNKSSLNKRRIIEDNQQDFNEEEQQQKYERKKFQKNQRSFNQNRQQDQIRNEQQRGYRNKYNREYEGRQRNERGYERIQRGNDRGFRNNQERQFEGQKTNQRGFRRNNNRDFEQKPQKRRQYGKDFQPQRRFSLQDDDFEEQPRRFQKESYRNKSVDRDQQGYRGRQNREEYGYKSRDDKENYPRRQGRNERSFEQGQRRPYNQDGRRYNNDLNFEKKFNEAGKQYKQKQSSIYQNWDNLDDQDNFKRMTRDGERGRNSDGTGRGRGKQMKGRGENNDSFKTFEQEPGYASNIRSQQRIQVDSSNLRQQKQEPVRRGRRIKK